MPSPLRTASSEIPVHGLVSMNCSVSLASSPSLPLSGNCFPCSPRAATFLCDSCHRCPLVQRWPLVQASPAQDVQAGASCDGKHGCQERPAQGDDLDFLRGLVRDLWLMVRDPSCSQDLGSRQEAEFPGGWLLWLMVTGKGPSAQSFQEEVS